MWSFSSFGIVTLFLGMNIALNWNLFNKLHPPNATINKITIANKNRKIASNAFPFEIYSAFLVYPQTEIETYSNFLHSVAITSPIGLEVKFYESMNN